MRDAVVYLNLTRAVVQPSPGRPQRVFPFADDAFLRLRAVDGAAAARADRRLPLGNVSVVGA